ncbi:DUF2283 domain-containing protein [bacterium]|nr:DUF2283 domain-containing protein [bacterium]
MKLNYYPETDSLYIELTSDPGASVVEIAPGVVADFSSDGRLVGLDIDHASKVADLSQLVSDQLPLKNA